MEKGKVIILDGCPSSGKTTIAEEIQASIGDPYLYAGIDTFVHMIPENWISFSSELNKVKGIEFIFSTDEGGKSMIKLGVNPTVEKLVRGYVNAIKGLAEAGNNVIADGVITKKEWFDYIKETFDDLTTCYVGLYAPLEVLEKRESARWDLDGQARGHFKEVYELQKEYDLFIDTSETTVLSAAKTIIDFMKRS